MYEFLDKNKGSVLKNMQTLFNNSRLRLLKIDELNTLNVSKEVDVLFKKIQSNAEDIFEGEIRSLSKSTGKDKGFFVMNKYLDAFNPVLLYVYLNELERKKARYVEGVIASQKANSLQMMNLMKTNIRNMTTQILETVAYMEFEGTKDAFLDDGVEHVIWHAENDAKTCGTCSELDGQVFPIDDCPDPQHIGCRCWIEPASEKE